MKKFTLIFLIFAITSQVAFAFVPFLVAGSRIVSASLSTTTGQVLIGAPIGIGLAFSVFNFSRTGSDGSMLETSIYQTNAPRPPSPEEAAAGFTPGYPSITPKATVTASPQWRPSDGVGSFSDGDAAARDHITRVYTQWHTDSTNVNPASGTQWIAHITANNNAGLHQSIIAANSFIACPAGYSASGNNCYLANAADVSRPSDGRCPINKDGNSYSSDPSDPDCTSTGATPTFAPDGSFTITGADGTTISSSPDVAAGDRKIVYSYADTARNVTKQREIYTSAGATAASPTIVRGVSDKEIPGIGAAAVGAPAVSVGGVSVDNTGVIAAINADRASREAWNAGQPARKAADRAADRQVPATEQIPKETIPWLSDIPTLFSSSASCPPPITFTMMGKPYSIEYDPMCTVMDTLRPLILALGAFGAAMIFMGGIKI